MATKTRSRSRSLVPFTEGNLTKTCITGCTSTTIGPIATAWDLEEMDDVVTDRYHERIAAGEIINNPVSYERDSLVTTGQAHHRYRGATIKYDTKGPLTGRLIEVGLAPVNISFDFKKDLEAEAKLRAIASIDNTPFAFGEDVLELKETVRFLRNPVAGLFNLSTKFRKEWKRRSSRKKGGRLRTQYELLDAHAKLWLEYRFAVSPLIRSSIDALDAYSSELPTLPERLSARGFSTEEYESADQKEGQNSWWFQRYRNTQKMGKATILYTVSNPVYDWRYRLGFRAKDIPTTLWQVVPYSFMVDRVLDVTRFSQGVINLADPRVTLLMGCYTIHEDDSWSQTCFDRTVAESTIVTSDTYTRANHKYVRSPWSPSVSDTVPKLNLAGLTDSATKIADLTSLILGNFRPFK